MNGCKGNTSLCNDSDLRPVRFGVADPILMCVGCRSSALGREGTVVERRVMRQPITMERRWMPTWRRVGRGKDLTERFAA